MFILKFSAVAVIVFVVCNTIACKSSSTDPKETLDAIMKADNAGDIQKIISLYTSDAMLIPANKPNIIGKDAIRKNYENIFATSKLQLRGIVEEVLCADDLAVIRGNTIGTIILLKDNSRININDKFIMILKSEGMHWKIHRLMWSKNG